MTMNPAQPTLAPTASADEAALDWLIRRKDSPDAATEARFREWQAASPLHAQAYARWERDWSELDAVPETARAQWRAECPPPASAQPNRQRRARWRLAGAALAACAVAAVAALLATPSAPQYQMRYATAPGQQQEITLPDGSQVALDTATRVEVLYTKGRREVRMAEGQAMFKVQSDAGRPFDVVTGNVRVTVVGTRFSVRHTPATPGYPGVHVGVASGHVRVGPEAPAAWWEFWRPGRDRQVTDLTAGQQMTVDESGLPGRIARIDAASVAPWLDHRVAFDNATLAQALAEFGRYGHPVPVLGDPRLASLRLTGSFDTRSLATFYRVLPQALPVRIDTRDGLPSIEPAQ
ncbi:FecR domain-containing protein [Achromobacter veterisilvae]|uniref:FecR domain-containing protein n=1 Tax=Achromobacter veterisilvae TaxID=2069367 RepID=A0ABZ2RVQ9_9BURK